MHNQAYGPTSLVLNAQRLAPTVALQARHPEKFMGIAARLAHVELGQGPNSLLAPSRAVLASRHSKVDVSYL